MSRRCRQRHRGAVALADATQRDDNRCSHRRPGAAVCRLSFCGCWGQVAFGSMRSHATPGSPVLTCSRWRATTPWGFPMRARTRNMSFAVRWRSPPSWGELRRAGNERDAGRDHEIWCGVEHDAHFAAQATRPATVSGRKKVMYTSVRSANCSTRAPRPPLAGLHHAELHAAIAWAFSSAVGQLHVDAGPSVACSAHIGLGTGHLGAGGTDARLRGLGLRLSCCQGGLRAAHLARSSSSNWVEKKPSRASCSEHWQAPLGGIQIARAAPPPPGPTGNRSRAGPPAPGHCSQPAGPAAGGPWPCRAGPAGCRSRHAGHGLASCHKVALTHRGCRAPCPLVWWRRPPPWLQCGRCR